MDDVRDLGLVLIWLGAIVLVAVLQHRLRTGAFSQDALDHPHPVGRWAKTIAAVGSALAAAGIILTVWSFV